MAAPTFSQRLLSIQREKKSQLCVGLDPDVTRLPNSLQALARSNVAEAVVAFNRAIVDATANVAAAYKLNLAFFELLGAEGWRAIERTLEIIPDDALTIADGKRGDIGNSARFYAASCYDRLGFDACTVSGYMGRDSIDPFLEYEGRGTYLLARTSNPGGAEFQELECGDQPLYRRVVAAASRWDSDSPGVLGFVAGATDVNALHHIRVIAPRSPLLIPGVGAQGGNVRAVVKALAGGDGPILINSSRSIIYASSGEDYEDAAGQAATELRDAIASTGS